MSLLRTIPTGIFSSPLSSPKSLLPLDNNEYLKLCESSASLVPLPFVLSFSVLIVKTKQSNLKTMTDWRQFYEKNSRKILAVLKCRRIVGPAQFIQSPQTVVAPPVDSPSKIRYRSRLPLSHPAVCGLSPEE